MITHDERELDRYVRFHVYRRFAETGGPPEVDDIARFAGAPRESVEDSLRRLQDDHDLVLAPGSLRVWMAHPFSAVPTAYPVDTPERRYWANCAWDALAIPSLLGVDGRIVTACPDCGAPLTLALHDGALESTEAVVHFAVPPRRFWDNIGFT